MYAPEPDPTVPVGADQVADDAEEAATQVAVADEPAATGDAEGSESPEPLEVAEPPKPTPVQSFQAELARAMQAAAVRERQRIATTLADDATVQVEKVKTRAATETAELRRLAEEDVKGIADWSAAEIERIRRETARRTEERRASLEEHIVRHGGIIEREIGSVDRAVRDYTATLDDYFGQLAGSSDPAEIARLAGELPSPPDLQEVRAIARSTAVAEASSDADDGDGDGPGGAITPVGVAVPIARPVANPGNEAGEGPEPGEGPESGDSGNAAVRLLRTIAPWTAPADRPDEDQPPTAS
jgi:hypothetical protein